jgi:hypothetical protein
MIFCKFENSVFHCAFSGTHIMMWVVDDVVKLPSLLVQLIDDITTPFFFYVKKASVFICWGAYL